MRIVPWIVCVSLVLCGCGDPRDKVLPKQLGDLQQMQSVLDKLTPAEREELGKYYMRHTVGAAFGGAKMQEGVTIRQALAEQNSWEAEKTKKEAEAAALKAKLAQQQAELKKQVEDAVLVAYVGKKDDANAAFMDSMTLTFGIQNKGSKDIAGVKGTAVFVNVFGDRLADVGFSYDKTVPAGGTATVTYRMISMHDGYYRLRDADASKIKFDFVPSQIVFGDGSKLTMPDSATSDHNG